MIIKAGTIIILEWGVYSDRVAEGPFIVLKDFDQAEASAAFEKAWRNGDTEREFYDVDDPPRPSTFPAWMARRGYIEDVSNSHRWFLGEYDFEPVISYEQKQDNS